MVAVRQDENVGQVVFVSTVLIINFSIKFVTLEEERSDYIDDEDDSEDDDAMPNCQL